MLLDAKTGRKMTAEPTSPKAKSMKRRCHAPPCLTLWIKTSANDRKHFLSVNDRISCAGILLIRTAYWCSVTRTTRRRLMSPQLVLVFGSIPSEYSPGTQKHRNTETSRLWRRRYVFYFSYNMFTVFRITPDIHQRPRSDSIAMLLRLINCRLIFFFFFFLLLLLLLSRSKP